MSENNDLTANIETDKGAIRLKLFGSQAPLTVANFVNLVNREYYNDLSFHRVLPNFMVQGGCPDGNGRGGPGYKFEDEFVSELCHDKPGMLSMANAGPKTNGSQFFITHTQTPWLDQKHTVFGEVVSEDDQKIVDSIAPDDKISRITIEGDVSELMENNKDRIDEWNDTLDKKFPDLPKTNQSE